MKKLVYNLLLIVIVVLFAFYLKSIFSPSGKKQGVQKKEIKGKAEKIIELTTNWEDGYIEVKAVGIPNPRRCKNLAEEKVWALTEARKLAIEKLSEEIDEIKIDSTTTIKNERMKNHSLSLSLKSFILGAREMEKPQVKKMPDGSSIYIVTMGVIINPQPAISALNVKDKKEVEENSLTAKLTPYIKKLYKNKPYKFYSILKKKPEQKTEKKLETSFPDKNYTGLIVDTKGLHIQPAMAPKLALEDGRVVYGILDVDTDWVQKNGLVAYTKSMEKAKQMGERVGENPLIVKGKKSKFNVDVIIDKEDAAKIKYYDIKNNFLSKCKVIFVVD